MTLTADDLKHFADKGTRQGITPLQLPHVLIYIVIIWAALDKPQPPQDEVETLVIAADKIGRENGQAGHEETLPRK